MASTNEYCSTVKFNIVDAREYALNDRQRAKKTYLVKDGDSSINGKPVYARILICPIKENFHVGGEFVNERQDICERLISAMGDGTNLGQFEVNGEGKYKRILLHCL